jgi:hypothetical protein
MLVNATNDVDAAVRIVCTDAADPVTDAPTTSDPEDRSTHNNTSANPTPANKQVSGTSHNRL